MATNQPTPEEPNLSDTDRRALELMSRFSSEDKRQKFIEILEENYESILRRVARETEREAAVVEAEEESPRLSSAESLKALLDNVRSSQPNRREIQALIKDIEGEDLAPAIEILNELAVQDPQYRRVLVNFVREYGSQDPSAALGLSPMITAKSDRLSTENSILRGWAQREPYAALEWLRQDTSTGINTNVSATRRAFNTIAEQDFEAAYELLDTIEDPYTRDRAALGVFTAYLDAENVGTEDIQAYINAQAPEKQSDFLATVYQNGNVRGFDAGVAFAESLEANNPELAQEAYIRAAQSKSRNYPQEVADWALTLNDPSTQGTVIKNTIDRWVRYDLAEAGTWLASIPEKPEYDAAFGAYAQHAVNSDPAGAVTWAESINDAKTRESTVTQVVSKWAQQDKSGALGYLQSTPYLERETREQLILEIQQN